LSFCARFSSLRSAYLVSDLGVSGMTISVPYSLELEQNFLGDAIFDTRSRIEELAQSIRPEHFYDLKHQEIWASAIAHAEHGVALTADGLAKIIGEDLRPYLVDLQDRRMRVNPAYCIKGLRDLALRREVVEFGEVTKQDACDPSPTRSGHEILEAAEARLYAVAEHGSGRKRASSMADARRKTDEMIDRVQKGEGFSGIATGIAALDKRLGGLRDSELIITAGRPGMGKTAFALTLAVSAAKSGNKVKFISLEMSEEQLVQRLYAQFTGISVQEQLKPGAPLSMFRRLADAGNALDDLPITIDASDTQTIASIRAEARRDKRRNGLDLLIIDYLGLIQPTDPKAQKVHQIEQITTGLKRLSKELSIPVVLLAQLNRGVESRDDKRPGLADLRDSGSIEQDADVVLLLYRAEYYLAKEEPEDPNKFADWDRRRNAARGRADIITAKYRQGEVGTDTVRFDGVRQMFADLEGGAA
jgi:replicative DNA helicase